MGEKMGGEDSAGKCGNIVNSNISDLLFLNSDISGKIGKESWILNKPMGIQKVVNDLPGSTSGQCCVSVFGEEFVLLKDLFKYKEYIVSPETVKVEINDISIKQSKVPEVGWLEKIKQHLIEHGRVGWVAKAKVGNLKYGVKLFNITVDLGSAKLKDQIGGKWTEGGYLLEFSEGRTKTAVDVLGYGVSSSSAKTQSGDWVHGPLEFMGNPDNPEPSWDGKKKSNKPYIFTAKANSEKKKDGYIYVEFGFIYVYEGYIKIPDFIEDITIWD